MVDPAPLVRLMTDRRSEISGRRGTVPPPHLTNCAWTFKCCTTWSMRMSAEWRNDAWRNPRQQCPQCFQFTTGYAHNPTLDLPPW